MTEQDFRRRTDVDAVAEHHLDAWCAADPLFATFAGVPGYDGEVTDLSPEGHAARADLVRRTLAELGAARPVDDVDEVTVAALRERLGLFLEQHDAGLMLGELNNIASPVQSLRECFDLMPTGTQEDWVTLTRRAAALPRAMREYRRSLRAAVDGGWAPPVRQIRVAAQQCAEFGETDGFFAQLPGSAPADLPAGLRDDLAAATAAAAAAYQELGEWLRAELGPVARAEDDEAVGREQYQLHSRGFVGTTVDLDEAYAWGIEELARIEGRMAQIGRRLDPSAPAGCGLDDVRGAIGAGIAALDADPSRRIEGAEAFRDWMQHLSDTAVAELGREHFDIPEPVRTLRCRLSPSTSGTVYYTGPSEDFARPGQMWWAVPAGVTTFSTWQETSTVYHEGVPGHHLQIGQTLYRADVLNRWRRVDSWVSGHGEGWALYAERLMEELGYLQDDGDLMGMLDAHALRACRVVVDIGVHCRLTAPDEVGGGVWDATKAWAFLRRHTRMPDPNLRFELDRYLGWPGQAPSYKLGEQVWLGLRDTAKSRLGAAFDLRAFHRAALDVGGLSLDVLPFAVLGALGVR